MNHTYRVVWNAALRLMQVASERTGNRCKAGGRASAVRSAGRSHAAEKFLVALMAVVATGPVAAATFTAGSGNWSNGANWQSGIAPVSSNTTEITLIDDDTRSDSTHDLGAFTLNRLSVTTPYPGSVQTDLFSSGGSSLIFDGIAPTVEATENARSFRFQVGPTVVLNETLTVSSSGSGFDLAMSGVSGAGGLVIESGAGVTLKGGGAATYSGNTTIRAGASLVTSATGSGDQLSSESAHIVNGLLRLAGGDNVIGSLAGSGTVQIVSSYVSLAVGALDTDTTFSGSVSGLGSLTKLGSGTLTLTGNITHSGGTRVENGMLDVSAFGALGAGAVTVEGGRLQFRDQASAGDAEIINNTPGLSSIVFRGSSTAGTARMENLAGLLYFLEGASADRATIVNHQIVAFQGSASAGSARLINQSGGRLLFRSASNADGAIVVNNGGAQIDLSSRSADLGIGSLSGAGAVYLGDNALTLGALGMDDSIGGAIQDGGEGGGTGGSLIKAGAGTLVLSGANTYTGATRVDAGTLLVNGSLGGSGVLVDDGATLGGSGVVNAAVQVATGGTLSPGNSPGILSLEALSLAPGSTTVMEIEGATPGIGHDQLRVASEATLDGTLELRFGYTPADGDRFRLIEAGRFILAGDAQTGFAEITSNLGAALRAHVEIDPSSFDILIALAQQDYAAFATSDNQRAVASHLDSFSRSGQAGELIAALNELPAERLPAALDALSGVPHTHVQQLVRQLGSRFHQSLAGRLPRGELTAAPLRLAMAGALDGLGAAADPAGQGTWIRAQGLRGSFEGDANAAGAEYRGGGFALGVDTGLGESGLFGLAAGYTRSTLEGEGADLDVESAQLAAYGAWHGDRAYLSGSLAYGRHGIDSDRRVRVGSLDETARANYHGDAVSADLEAGLPLGLGENGRLTPFAGVGYSRFERDGFTESGTGEADLRVEQDTDHSLMTRLGVRYGARFESAGGTGWRPLLEVAWLREHRDPRARLDAGFEGVGGTFAVHGPALSRDRLRLAAGVGVEITGQTRLEIAYATERAGDQHADRLALSLQHRW